MASILGALCALLILTGASRRVNGQVMEALVCTCAAAGWQAGVHAALWSAASGQTPLAVAGWGFGVALATGWIAGALAIETAGPRPATPVCLPTDDSPEH